MSALFIAPYNDSMRLGQGYNSFLQSPCLLNAVNVASRETSRVSSGTQAQTVSYSSRIVTKLSEVARAMHISAGSAIRNGTISASAGLSDLDEAKFGESDLNVVVSVRVVNQTNTILDDVAFVDSGIEPMDGQRFHRTYGDTFISGFIEGGDLHGIISIRTLDISKRKEVKSAVVSHLNASPTEWHSTTSKPLDDVLRLAEVTVNVNWSGGGDINPTGEEWTLATLLQEAASFPRNVAKCPQRTCAILSRYDTVPNFIKYAALKRIAIDRYDGCQSLASDLLDMHMGFKSNLSIVNHAMNHLDRYNKNTPSNAIEITVPALIEARKQIKVQMRKIAELIDNLNVSPTFTINTEPEPTVESPELWKTRLPILKPAIEVSNIERQFSQMLGALPIGAARTSTIVENLSKDIATERTDPSESINTSRSVPKADPPKQEAPASAPAPAPEPLKPTPQKTDPPKPEPLKYDPRSLMTSRVPKMPQQTNSIFWGTLRSSLHFPWRRIANETLESIPLLRDDQSFEWKDVAACLVAPTSFYLLGDGMNLGGGLYGKSEQKFLTCVWQRRGQFSEEVSISWAAIPRTRITIESSSVALLPKTPVVTKTFSEKFKNKPQVLVFIDGVESKGVEVRVQNNIYNIQKESFTVSYMEAVPDFEDPSHYTASNTAQVYIDMYIHEVGLRYLAYDPVEAGDRIQVVEHDIESQNSQIWPETKWPKPFPVDPIVFTYFKEMNFNASRHFAVSAEILKSDKNSYTWRSSVQGTYINNTDLKVCHIGFALSDLPIVPRP